MSDLLPGSHGFTLAGDIETRGGPRVCALCYCPASEHSTIDIPSLQREIARREDDFAQWEKEIGEEEEEQR